MKASPAGTDTVTFKYDPFGRRIEKSVATIEDGLPTTYKYTYVYDNEDIILEVLERTQDGVTTTTTTSYVHGPGIDEPLSFTREGQTYYYHADGLGSITAVTDTNGAVVNRYAYDTFGRVQRSETVRNAYTFTGREYDSETGLYFYRARYYDPEAGRFVSKDPIGFAGGDVNLYGYVSQNPVNWVDPWGLSPIGFAIKITKKGFKILFKLESKAAAVEARKQGLNVIAKNRSNAKAIERAFSGEVDILRHKGHVLPDGSTGRPHYQTAGKRGHTFWGMIIGLVGSFLDPFDAISGELAGDEEGFLLQYYQMEQKSENNCVE